jgi:two-component system CheB/CheR fusion protein
MSTFVKRLSLPVKLLLLIVFPLALIVFLTIWLYREKSENAALVNNYLDRIHISANISDLISSLQAERKYSYNYMLTREEVFKDSIRIQRSMTDKGMEKLDDKEDRILKGFPGYTYLDRLDSMRSLINRGISQDAVMHYYTTSIFRLHTLDGAPVANNKFLDPVFNDLAAENIVNEMVTYLEILNSNFYNALYNKQNNILMLFGLQGVYDVYKSYEKEFLVKASPDFVARYQKILTSTELKFTIEYIDSVYKKYQFDFSISAEDWWQQSSAASRQLKAMKTDMLSKVISEITQIHDDELKSRDVTLIILLFALILVFAIMLYVTNVITHMLSSLKTSAQRIAVGETDIKVPVQSDDVIGTLGESIQKIDQNNKVLAQAAEHIGHGDFQQPLYPRSDKDLLVNAMIHMRDNLQRFKEETIMLEERKDDFIKMASHELKTPVTTIKGYVQLLLMMHSKEKDPALVDSLLTIDKQTSKLTKLVTDLLDATRIETGKFEIRKEPSRISEFLTDLIKDTRTTSLTHAVVLNQYADPLVLADKDRMMQVVSNLFSNAIKYSPNSSKIVVEIREKDNRAIISVQDFGIGISMEDKDKVFERFFRVPGKQESTFPGFGIGLYIVKEIVLMHDGRVWVEGQKGKGSTFYISLPVYRHSK